MKKEKLKKIVTIITIITTITTLISTAFNFLVPMYLVHKLHIDTNKATSIGIIGSADGPTTIFMTGPSLPYLLTTIFALLSIAGIIYLKFASNTMK